MVYSVVHLAQKYIPKSEVCTT